jgi:hypothetical protein
VLCDKQYDRIYFLIVYLSHNHLDIAMASQRSKSKNETFSSASPSQSFEFINFTDAPHMNECDRDIIRSRAITDYHHRKRTNNPRSAAQASLGAQGSIRKFRLHRQTLEDYKRSMPAEQIQQPMAELSIPDMNQSSRILGRRAREVTAEDPIKKLDLLATNLHPLLNLPIDSSDRMRLWIHHYCKFPWQ